MSEPATSNRGFKHMPPVQGTRGETVRAYESSAAMGPHIWLSVDTGSGERHGVHLTAQAAALLAGQLLNLVENHYQGDIRDAGWGI